jgi:hypothetical protein
MRQRPLCQPDRSFKETEQAEKNFRQQRRGEKSFAPKSRVAATVSGLTKRGQCGAICRPCRLAPPFSHDCAAPRSGPGSPSPMRWRCWLLGWRRPRLAHPSGSTASCSARAELFPDEGARVPLGELTPLQGLPAQSADRRAPRRPCGADRRLAVHGAIACAVIPGLAAHGRGRACRNRARRRWADPFRLTLSAFIRAGASGRLAVPHPLPPAWAMQPFRIFR